MMMNAEVDVRAVLPSISVPTLVLHRAEEHFIDIRHSRYLAEHIPGARYVELPGSEVFSFTHAGDELLDEVQEFLTGMRRAPRSRAGARDRDVRRHRRLDADAPRSSAIVAGARS